jgi:RNA polymerase sigma-70 factor (ECF subfamily)
MEAEAVAVNVVPAGTRQDAAVNDRQLTGNRLPEAFERLFVAEYPRVVAIANRVLANRHEAEEVGQEVFLSFHRRHDPEAAYAAAWLHRAAWHSALNIVRGNRRRERREEVTARASDEQVADPQAILERSEQRQMVRDAMARLPKKSSAVLALRYSGLSYAEVANALGVSIGQVGTLLRRAEARLRTEVTNATPY